VSKPRGVIAFRVGGLRKKRASEPIPQESPVAKLILSERRRARKGVPAIGAAERTLAREHRSGTRVKSNLDANAGLLDLAQGARFEVELRAALDESRCPRVFS
jgi:hypothetical protein